MKVSKAPMKNHYIWMLGSSEEMVVLAESCKGRCSIRHVMDWNIPFICTVCLYTSFLNVLSFMVLEILGYSLISGIHRR